MRLAIITMFRLNNYGSVLQAFATQQVIKRMGIESDIVDYKYPNEYQYKRGFKRPSKTSLKYKIAKILGIREFLSKIVKSFISQYIQSTHFFTTKDEILKDLPIYDIYLVGSDQVWNPRFMKGDDVFLLSFAPSDKKKISYSSSFACNSIADQYIDSYKEWLSKFSAISVREKQGVHLIKELTGKDVTVTLDPTLLLNKEEWLVFSNQKPFKSKKNYILLYMLGYAFDPSPDIYNLLKYYQEKYDYKVISFTPIPKQYSIKNVKILYRTDFFDFLHYFANASLVITSSLHGTAFALNFGKPLISVVNDKNKLSDDRQCSILESLNLESCVFYKESAIDSVNPYYDKIEEQKNLQQMRDASISYLKRAIFN